MDNLDFQQSVIARSHEVPVLVDFWAEWCQPCRLLAPIIEELAEEAEGKWELFKVDTDKNRQLAKTYNIRGIPAVKLFHKGTVVGEFAGVRSRKEIKQWLQENLPDERMVTLTSIKERLFGAEREKAIKELKKFTISHPEIEEGFLWLASIKVFENPQEARRMLENILIGDLLYERAQAIRHLANLMECPIDESEIAQKVAQIREDLKKGDFEQAIEKIIEAVKIDKHYCEDIPRKSGVALFQLAGFTHELNRKYRSHFDMAMY